MLKQILKSRIFFYVAIIVAYYVFYVHLRVNIIDVIFSFFKFIVINFFSFFVLFMALKKEDKRDKLILCSVSAISLFVSYYYNITNNIAVLVFYFFRVYEKREIRILVNCVVVFIFLYPFISPFYYRYVYGFPEDRIINSSNLPEITLIDDSEKEYFKTKKYTIEMKKVAFMQLDAKAVYIEHYDSLFSYDYYQNELYDEVAPLDLSVFVGNMALEWKNYKIKHDRRVLFIYNQANADEHTNIHIIPANDIIHKGFKSVVRGDDVYLKGYLIDWNGIDEFSYFNIKTARSFNEASRQLIGGNFSFLCMQFFVEELNVNGFTFK